MSKHKLSGYCIRGGEQIAERIRKVFEADGVDASNWSYQYKSNFYFVKDSFVDTDDITQRPDHLTEITIEQAEAIVYGSTPEKTFPREMLVSDNGKDWDPERVFGYCEDIEWSWLVYVDGSISSYEGWLFAREIPETIPYNRAKEIISDFIDKGVNDFEIEAKKE